MNRVVLVGRLTKDPELRYTPAGVAVATFTLAVNRTFTNQQGEREADFIQCVVWRKPAENVANFLKKGSMAGVDGRVQTRNYEGNNGKRVYVTEIVAESVQFLEPKSSANGGARAPFLDERSVPPEKEIHPSSSNSPSEPLEERNGPITVSDDDLPF
ncbi:single-stranded DNA-binding protein [Listeria farberi]|uniref:single-stranded DNA-binding protein n=1 Tax=Listeria farberi TaxID=2713500 RepID=UPI0028A2BEBE|nr:single-stranded DNA-binding protein [Listeria farberi]